MKKIVMLIVLLSFIIGCQSSTSSTDQFTEPIQEQGQTFWWNDVVFYEIFVRSFYDSDGDGIGDIQGIIQKLDYLNDGNPNTSDDLGIGGIWLMPITQSPSYHGYDVTDYKEIEEDYGSNDDFLQLIDQCHSRGIKVIIDYVMNHSSNQHPWFEGSSQADTDLQTWYLWKNNDPGYTQPWGNYPVWHQHENGQYYYGIFWGGMPDLNYTEPAVKDTMFAIADFWLSEMHVDGFRCDAVKYIYEDNNLLENLPETYQFWDDFNNLYKGVNPEAMAVGEAWDATDIILNYVDGKFDFCFEFNLAQYIFSAVTDNSPSYIRNKMVEIKQSYPYHQYGTFLTNHDQNRIFSALGQNISDNKLAASVYLTLPGIPFLYYGEEIGMLGSKPDENIRRPMQWTSESNAGFSSGTPWHQINSNYNVYNVQDEQQNDNSLWRHYNKLITLRNQETSLTRGTYQAIGASNSIIYAYLRQYDDQAVFVIHNFSNSSQTAIEFQAEFTNMIQGDYEIIDLTEQLSDISNFSISLGGTIENWIPIQELEAKTSYILKLIKK